MRLFLLGATGNSERRFLKYALERGHQVTAFVRDQNKLLEILGRRLPEGLHVIAGNIDKPTELTTAMIGHDVVINADVERGHHQTNALQQNPLYTRVVGGRFRGPGSN